MSDRPESGRTGFDPKLRVAPPTFEELTAFLVWPMLLRGLPQSLRPGHLLVGGAGALLLWLIVSVLGWLGVEPALPPVAGSAWGAAPFVALGDALAGRPWAGLLTLALTLPVVHLVGLVVGRSVALDLGADLLPTTGQCVAFAAPRAPRVVWLTLIVGATIGAGLGIVSLLGWVFGPLAFDQGGPVFLVAFAVALATVVYAAAALLTAPMHAPAIAADDCDALEALQRCLAFVLGAPLRFLAYLAVVWGVFSLALAALLALLSWAALLASTGDDPAGASGPGFFGTLALLVPLAWALSYAGCAGTVLYLALRRVCDEQDVAEVWLPPAPGDASGGA